MSFWRKDSLRLAGFALMAAAVIGCAGGESKPLVSVSGTIAFADGRPLPTGTRLMFNPGDGRTESAIAVTGPDGAFEAVRVSGGKGVSEGKYVVLLRAPEGDQGNFFKIIPSEYYSDGVLIAEVKDGMSPLALRVATKKRG
jgi:hypothetical protein